MNAYELAEKLLAEVNCFDHQCAFDAASMLRQQANDVGSLNARLKQQADRIAELEKSQMAWYEAGKFVTPQIKELSDRELVVFLMDEIDRASEWLVDGETHMAIGVLGQCHAKIRKHLSNTKES